MDTSSGCAYRKLLRIPQGEVVENVEKNIKIELKNASTLLFNIIQWTAICKVQKPVICRLGQLPIDLWSLDEKMQSMFDFLFDLYWFLLSFWHKTIAIQISLFDSKVLSASF